jgi:hypothetical protein
MRVNGKTIYSTAKASKHGRTKVGMRESTLTEGNTASAATNGTMEASTLVTGVKIRSVASVFIRGSTVADTRANG